MQKGINMNCELISVIVPIYNIEKYLPQCIESIVKQTYTNLEIILVNDGSTDSSGDICNKYSLNDSRIVVINKENGGLSDARNAGIEAANGSYIGFVDGDDWIEEMMYQNLLSAIKEFDADLSFGVTERETRKHFENNITNELVVIDGDDILNAYICPEHNPHILKAAWDKLYKRDLIGELRFIKGIHGEDGPFNMEIMCKAKKCVFVSKVIYHYRDVRPGNISSISIISPRLFTDRIPIALKQIEKLKKIGRCDLAKRQESTFVNELIDYYIEIKQEKHNQAMKAYTFEINKVILNSNDMISRVFEDTDVKFKLKAKIVLFKLAPAMLVGLQTLRKRREI